MNHFNVYREIYDEHKVEPARVKYLNSIKSLLKDGSTSSVNQISRFTLIFTGLNLVSNPREIASLFKSALMGLKTDSF
jgi:hypothetical protein